MEAVDRGALTAPEPLKREHLVASFHCGVEELDRWLIARALRNEADGISRTFVSCAGKYVVAYYSLAATSVSHAVATGKARRNAPDPVPAALLARLAVHTDWQRQKLGIGLLQDAVLRVSRAAEHVGIRVMLVHAISDDAERFYERFGFRRSPTLSRTLMITVEELQRMIAKVRN